MVSRQDRTSPRACPWHLPLWLPRSVSSLALLALVSPIFFPAHAHTLACDKSERALARLAEKYKEMPEARGITNKGNLAQILAHEDGKTWTFIVTMPNGVSCLLEAGESWETVIRVIGNPS